MATHGAEAQIRGNATVFAGTSVVYASGASIEADSYLAGSLTGLFWGQWSVLGDSDVLVPGSISKKAVTSLCGDATAFAFAQFLATTTVGGTSSIAAPAVLEAAATSSLEGVAEVASLAQTVLTAVSSPVGDALVGAPATVALKATALLLGDASLVVRALADDEIAGDLQGHSSIETSATGMYTTVGNIGGRAGMIAVPLLRKPHVSVDAPTVEEPERLIGYQPGREAVVVEPSYVVNPNPTRTPV